MKHRVHHFSAIWWTLVSSILATFLVIATLPATSGALSTVTSGNIVTDTYGYTGATETLTIPSDVTSISLTMTGAEGGRGGRDSSGTAPLGGYQGEVTGTLAVTPGQVLTIAVGQGGASSTVWNACTTGWNAAAGDPKDAVGGLNPLGYDGGNGGSPGPSGCSGYGGSGGGASVVEVGTSGAPTSAAVLVAGGSGGSGGSGQFSPTLGQISLPTYQARPDVTSTTGQNGEYVYTACHQVTGQQCDGGGGAGGGGGAQGGSAGLVEFGSGTSDEWFGLGAYPGENDTNSLPGLSSQYVFYANDNANGTVVISYSTGVPAAPTAVYGSPGNASASLYWGAPSSSGSIPAPSSYVVQYATSPYSSWTTTSSCTGTTTTCTVTGLTNGTPYEFEVAAVNTNGQGQFSAPSSPVTPSGPPGAPNISGIVPSDGSLIVSFSGASSTLPISSYQYSLDGGSTWNPGGVTTSPLTIEGLTNGTTYSVEIRAVNGAGDGADSASVAATPSVVPGEPTITSITPGGDGTSLSVTFIAGYVGGSPITGYDYATSLGANTTAFGTWTTVGGTTSPFVITGLSSGSTYSVELRAINAEGAGQGSPYANGVTLAVPDQPTITSVTPGDSSLQVSYLPYSSSNDGGSPISGIDYSLDGGTTWTSAGTLADPFTIAALSNGTTYGVLLRADNGVGSSVVSSSVNGTPRTLPSAPIQVQVLSAPGAAQVSWSPPVTTGGAPVTGYTASAFAATSGGAALASCTSTTTSCQISGLSNDVIYYVEAVATNVAGPGPASSPRVSALPAALPGAPTISTLTAGNSYLAVPFTAGTFDTNAPITGYQYSTDGGNTWTNASGTSSPVVISGLTNGTAYTVAVRAVSAIGSGAPSNSEIGTPYAAPDPTANATTSYTAGSQQVTVSWLAPNDNGAAISSYTVTAFTAAISGTQASTCTTAALSCTLTGLTNGTTYYISIQSVNVFTQYSLRSSPRISVLPGTPSSTTLTASPTSSSYGTSVTLSAAITSGATGTVTFSVNGSSISGCSSVAVTSSAAQCVTTTLPAGSDILLASYSGDSSHASSSGSDSFSVALANQAALTLTTTSTNYVPSPGNSVTLATSGGTTGAGVTYVVSPSVNNAGCSISGVTLTYTSSGSCQVTATMAGNTNYSAVSSIATTFSVNSTSSTTTLTASPTSSSYGTSVTLSAAITSGATGTVAFSVNGAGISGCSSVTVTSSAAQCVTTTLPAGSDTLRASYSGDPSYAASSGTDSFNVGRANQAALTLTTTSTNYVPSPGNTVALTTSGGTTGAGVTYVVSPSANSAGCSISGTTLTYTSSGSCQVTATMAANANYNAVSSSATTFSVALANQAALTLTTTSTNYAPSPDNTAHLATSGGTTGAGVTYVVSPSANNAGCSTSGSTLTYSSSGSCQVTATMAGNANYSAISSIATTFSVALANQAALTLTTTST
ncbi:MAG TPA: fibronectin type III domain-containing protein, partial [Acidimicrobiales bacterium]